MSLKQNIIYLYFKGKHLITSKSQYQYNHGQYLYFADLDLPQTFEVHFSNRDRGDSKPQVGSNKLVEIPDEYYWSGALMIYAWIYLHTGKDDGETIYEVKIPLIKRAKPTDEEPLPVQQSAIDRAIAELNNAVNITNENADKTNADKTQVATIKEEVVTLKEEIDSTANAVSQDAQSARESADASEQSAQNSAESERKALDYSDEAKGYAQSALESKNIASQKAQIATDASAEAKDFRNEAETFKNEAEQAKQNIVDYRDETKGYRDETLNLKNTVQTLKNQVDETAEEIEDISDAVKEDAQSASRSASSANQSSINASQSASQADKSANDAEKSANQAEQNKSQTETFKNQSEEYKTQAGAFKSQAETFKNQAEEFKNQTETNVTHYPKIIGEYWYVWDATNGEYINTNVDANGIKGDTGRGIASIALNDDYTLTITFTDDTTYTTSSIRGQQGEKGDTGKTGESGVYIGTEEPENEDIKVWIDTDDDGTSEDLVADIVKLQETDKKILNTYPTKTVSGDIVSFDDSVEGLPLEKFVVDINPVQDLHGYDSPWVGGGGKNLVDVNSPTSASTNISAVDGVITSAQPSGAGSNRYISYTVTGLTIGTTYYLSVHVLSNSTGDRIKITLQDGGTGSAQTGYGSTGYIGFSFEATATTIIFRVTQTANGSWSADELQLETGTERTTYSPYENICPISGWTGMQIQHTKKNLLPLNIWNGITYNASVGTVFTPTLSNKSWTQNENSITYETTATYTTLSLMTGLLPKGTYKFSIHKLSTGALRFTRYVFDKNYVVVSKFGDANITTASTTMTLEEDGYIAFRLDNGTTASQTVEITIQVEVGDTETPYEPYNGTTIPINWQSEAGTVYGGTLDVLSGKLTVDRYVEDLSQKSWTTRYAGNKHITLSTSLTNAYPRAKGNQIISENYVLDSVVGVSTLSDPDNVNAGLYWYNNDASLTPAVIYVVTNVNMIPSGLVVYPLAESIEIQLTPTEVRSLLGQNNIFANTGDSTVEYIYDPIKYIDDQINVDDVQINGESIVVDGIAEIPFATSDTAGVVKVDPFKGIYIGAGDGILRLSTAGNGAVKAGTDSVLALKPTNQHISAFYGLAKASGTDEKDSELPLGQYTDEAKTSIQNMLDVPSKNDVTNSLAEVVNIKSDVITDTASGAIASFSDGADNLPLKSLTVDINPIQDLHGYDHPWIGGGGKNLFDESKAIANTIYTYIDDEWSISAPYGQGGRVIQYTDGVPVSNGQTITISADAKISQGSESTNKQICVGAKDSATNGAYNKADITLSDFDTWERVSAQVTTTSDHVWVGIQPRNSDTNNVVTFKNVQVEVGSTATDWTPYENICPISGWTGCEVNATNTNLCGGSKLLANAQNYVPYGETNIEEEYFQFTSGASTNNDYRFTTGTPFKEKTRYTFIFTIYKTSGAGSNLRIYYTDGSFSNLPNVSSAEQKTTIVYTSSNGKTVSVLSKSNMSGSTRIYYNESGIFEGILTADQFEQFGKYIPISWQTEAGMVYGGKLDVLGGVMRVTHQYAKLLTTGWSLSGSNFWRSYSTMTNTRPAQIGWCTHYKNEVTATGDNTIIFGYSSFSASPRIVIRDSRFTTTSDFMAFLAEQEANGTPVMIAYPLAEPIEIQLTPQQVNSLLGVNNIWADTGNTEVEYRADTKLYINKKIAEALASLT